METDDKTLHEKVDLPKVPKLRKIADVQTYLALLVPSLSEGFTALADLADEHEGILSMETSVLTAKDKAALLNGLSLAAGYLDAAFFATHQRPPTPGMPRTSEENQELKRAQIQLRDTAEDTATAIAMALNLLVGIDSLDPIDESGDEITGAADG